MLGTASFVALSRTSWYQLRQAALWRERIRTNLGLDVVFASMEMPSPNRFRIHELVCAHPETQTPILLAELVEGIMTPNGWGVELHAAQMKQEQSDLALQILHDSFLCRPHNAVPILKLSIDEIRILPNSKEGGLVQGDAASLDSIHRVQIEYAPSLTQSEIKIQFGLSPSERQNPMIVHVVRNHEATNPRTEWAVNTRDVAVPCSPFSPYFPILAQVGPQGTFRGEVQWSQDAGGWESRITNGTFANTSWDSLTQSIGSPAQGRGTLYVGEAVVRNGVIDHFDGRLTADSSGGTAVEPQWLVDSMRTFGWESDLREGDYVEFQKRPTVRIDSLNLAFSLDANGVRWQGGGDEIHTSGMATHRQLASIENRRVAVKLSQGGYPLPQIGAWLARSGGQEDSADSIATWNAKIATMLPPPTLNARLSRLPNESGDNVERNSFR